MNSPPRFCQAPQPTPGYRFFTPFFHIPGAGSGFITRGSDALSINATQKLKLEVERLQSGI